MVSITIRLAIELNTEVLYVITPFTEPCSNSPSVRGDIRLNGGKSKFEGRVEVCGADNQMRIWKTVCNAGWDMNEAIVVCRQLGFSGNLNCMPSSNYHSCG